MIRYLDQPDKAHWPSGFSGRYHLFTCPAHPDAEAKDAAFAQALTDLREFLDQGTWWQQLRSGMKFVDEASFPDQTKRGQ